MILAIPLKVPVDTEAREQRHLEFEKAVIETYDPAKETEPLLKFQALVARDLQLLLGNMLFKSSEFGISDSFADVVILAQLEKALGAHASPLLAKGSLSEADIIDATLTVLRDSVAVWKELEAKRGK